MIAKALFHTELFFVFKIQNNAGRGMSSYNISKALYHFKDTKVMLVFWHKKALTILYGKVHKLQFMVQC